MSNLVQTMEFSPYPLGEEVKDFSYVPQGLEQMFSDLLHQEIEIQPDTGTFRKPDSQVFHDPFYQHTLWTAVIAVEDTNFKLLEHPSGIRSFFDLPEDAGQFVTEECSDVAKWNVVADIKLSKNQFVMVRPWLWKSLDPGKCVQVFSINAKLKEQ